MHKNFYSYAPTKVFKGEHFDVLPDYRDTDKYNSFLAKNHK